MTDIIIDIETLGTKPHSPIIEIGACVVDNRTGEITSNFSRRVPTGYSFCDLAHSCFDGADDDKRNTVRWWIEDAGRRDTLRKIMSRSVCVQEHAPLYEFCDWMMQQNVRADGNIRVWANGPQFDLVILQSAFDRYGIQRPWICWQERCVRTALEMANYEKGRVSWIERGPRHRALNDARHEARKLYLSGALGEVSMIARRMRQRGTAKGDRA